MSKRNHSIKSQLALIFIGLMAATIFLCWIINNTFLQRYYEDNRKNNLLETYHLLNDAANNNRFTSESFLIELEKKSSRNNIMGVVQDINGVIVGTFGNDMEMLKGLLWDRLYTHVANPRLILQDEHITIQKVIDTKTRTEYMEMVGTLTAGQAFYMRTPVENIRESVSIANRFLIYTGIIGIALSSIVIWFVSKKISKPVKQLADISKRMTKLDFDAKYSGKDNNEISALGDNFNVLSQTLEKTISELKTANNELKKDIEKKNEIDEMRKEFLSNVSHELKTPIALIQGYAEGLAEGMCEDEESRQYYCDVIMDESSKMNQMVKKLLTLNELEFGNEPVNMERFDIVDLICNYLHSADILIKQNDIVIRMNHYEPIFVWADEFKIEEVFQNYFTNAVNHANGEKIVDIKLTVNDNKVKINVFNTGDPIPDDSIEHLWEKFYKVDKARTRAYGGSGVGLSIVKAIMDSHNQKYGVENYENGVSFWFELETVGKENA